MAPYFIGLIFGLICGDKIGLTFHYGLKFFPFPFELLFATRQRSCGKVMFSGVCMSVILFTGGGTHHSGTASPPPTTLQGSWSQPPTPGHVQTCTALTPPYRDPRTPLPKDRLESGRLTFDCKAFLL